MEVRIKVWVLHFDHEFDIETHFFGVIGVFQSLVGAQISEEYERQQKYWEGQKVKFTIEEMELLS